MAVPGFLGWMRNKIAGYRVGGAKNTVLTVEIGVVSAGWGGKQEDTVEDRRTGYKEGGNGRGQEGPVG